MARLHRVRVRLAAPLRRAIFDGEQLCELGLERLCERRGFGEQPPSTQRGESLRLWGEGEAVELRPTHDRVSEALHHGDV